MRRSPPSDHNLISHFKRIRCAATNHSRVSAGWSSWRCGLLDHRRPRSFAARKSSLIEWPGTAVDPRGSAATAAFSFIAGACGWSRRVPKTVELRVGGRRHRRGSRAAAGSLDAEADDTAERRRPSSRLSCLAVCLRVPEGRDMFTFHVRNRTGGECQSETAVRVSSGRARSRMGGDGAQPCFVHCCSVGAQVGS